MFVVEEMNEHERGDFLLVVTVRKATGSINW